MGIASRKVSKYTVVPLHAETFWTGLAAHFDGCSMGASVPLLLLPEHWQSAVSELKALTSATAITTHVPRARRILVALGGNAHPIKLAPSVPQIVEGSKPRRASAYS